MESVSDSIKHRVVDELVVFGVLLDEGCHVGAERDNCSSLAPDVVESLSNQCLPDALAAKTLLYFGMDEEVDPAVTDVINGVTDNLPVNLGDVTLALGIVANRD